MAEVDTQLAEMLQAIRADISEIKHDIHRIQIRQTVVEGHLSSMIVSLQMLREQADETRDDIRLIKRRLELVAA